MLLLRMLHDEGGQTTTEYGLLLGMLGLAVVVTAAAIRGNLRSLFSKVDTELVAAGETIGNG